MIKAKSKAPAKAPAKAPVKKKATGTAPLVLNSISRSFRQGEAKLTVLDGASLTVERGEMVALVGESGSGKSTFLQIAGLLDTPDAGVVAINGQDAASMPDHKRTALRRSQIGFVYQFHHLLPDFSALENVMLPQIIAGATRKEARARAELLLGRLGLSARLEHRPGQLSGGEQQRVAIARSLANIPALLLADEPTGNLDPATAASVFRLLVELCAETGLAMLIVTHNRELAMQTDRVVTLSQGKIVPLAHGTVTAIANAGANKGRSLCPPSKIT